MNIKDLCESERPREKLLLQGAESLSNGELIAILLRNGSGSCSVLDLAQKLLVLAQGKLSELFQLSSERICSIQGIGPSKAATVMAAFELARRFLQEESSVVKTPLCSARMVFDLMLPKMKGLKHEECWVLLLNDNNYLIDKVKASSGGPHATVMDTKQVIRIAIEKNATGIILLHNHPSGNPRPSRQDIERTESLKRAATACELRLLDHIILCDDGFYSFAET